MEAAATPAPSGPPGGPSQLLQSFNSVLRGVGGEAQLKRRTKDGILIPATAKEVEQGDAAASLNHAAAALSKLSHREKMEWSISTRRRGNALYEEGKYQEAMAVYLESLLGLQPSDPQTPELRAVALSNMGACALKLGDNEKAAALCSEALHAQPGCFKARCRRATAYTNLEHFDKARADLKTAAETAKDDVQRKEAGLLQLLYKRAEEAARQGRKARRDFAQTALCKLKDGQGLYSTDNDGRESSLAAGAPSSVTGQEGQAAEQEQQHLAAAGPGVSVIVRASHLWQVVVAWAVAVVGQVLGLLTGRTKTRRL